MTSPPSANPQVTARKRGLRVLIIAAVLLLLALLLLAGAAPAVGERYPLVVRLAVYVLGGAGWGALLVGLHRVIVGPGAGPLAAVLKLIAVAVVVGGVLTGLLGAWLLHGFANHPRSASDGHHHHDWD